VLLWSKPATTALIQPLALETSIRLEYDPKKTNKKNKHTHMGTGTDSEEKTIKINKKNKQ